MSWHPSVLDSDLLHSHQQPRTHPRDDRVWLGWHELFWNVNVAVYLFKPAMFQNDDPSQPDSLQCLSRVSYLTMMLMDIILDSSCVQCFRVLYGYNICTACVKFSYTLQSYPGNPPASISEASVTALDQTSNCHFLSPRTPQWAFPEWIPTRIFTSTPVLCRTCLEYICISELEIISVWSRRSNTYWKQSIYLWSCSLVWTLSIVGL